MYGIYQMEGGKAKYNHIGDGFNSFGKQYTLFQKETPDGSEKSFMVVEEPEYNEGAGIIKGRRFFLPDGLSLEQALSSFREMTGRDGVYDRFGNLMEGDALDKDADGKVEKKEIKEAVSDMTTEEKEKIKSTIDEAVINDEFKRPDQWMLRPLQPPFSERKIIPQTL